MTKARLLTKMNKERFHNEIAMRLGYERIVKDKRITIEVEESETPWVTLKIQGCDDIKLKASKPDDNSFELLPEMRDDLKVIADAVHQAYIQANRTF